MDHNDYYKKYNGDYDEAMTAEDLLGQKCLFVDIRHISTAYKRSL